jgi:hypothetical protein
MDFDPGMVLDIPDDIAKNWIEMGLCDWSQTSLLILGSLI